MQTHRDLIWAYRQHAQCFGVQQEVLPPTKEGGAISSTELRTCLSLLETSLRPSTHFALPVLHFEQAWTFRIPTLRQETLKGAYRLQGGSCGSSFNQQTRGDETEC
jgi:hypothetical protein